MRVLHVLHTSLPHVCGYSLRSDQIIGLQAEMGAIPTVLTSVQQPDDANKEELLNGVKYFRTAKRSLWRSPIREYQLMQALSVSIRRVCAEVGPQIIHAHSPVLVGFPALRIARMLEIPFVYEVRDLWENASADRGRFAVNSLPYRAARALETYVLRRADAVFTIGENLRAELASRTSVTVHVAPNGVDVLSFVPEQPRPEWLSRWNANHAPLIAYVGSFQPYEGLDVLLRALPTVRTRVPEIRLIVAGDGPERASLETLAQQLGVSENVFFSGRVPHSQVREIYSVADLLIYPRIDTLTTRLTTPLKPLEAMSAGKAVLASNLPALRELVSDGDTGCLFESGNSEALASCVIQLLADPIRRAALGKAAQLAVQRKTWRSSVEGYIPVYREILRSQNGLRKSQ